jgi:hypothetical protein
MERKMSLTVDLFWSFRSPYSYLALPKTLRLVADYDLVVNARPVYPLAVRVPDFFKRMNPRGHSGGVALLAINNSRTDRSEITLPTASVRYRLSASNLQSASVMLNGKPLKLDPNDDLPEINGGATAAGPMHFAPATITFVAIPEAANAACAAVRG